MAGGDVAMAGVQPVPSVFGEEEEDDERQPDAPSQELPLEPVPVTDQFKPAAGDMDDAERLRLDLSVLPDAPDPSSIQSTPLAIAEAMLRGMQRRDGTCWREGQSLLGNDGLTEAQVPVPRAQGVGLGCADAVLLADRRGGKNRELLVAPGGGEKVRTHVGVSETLVRARRLEAGEQVVLLSGPHSGAEGVLTGCPPPPLAGDDRVEVQLCLGGTTIATRARHIRLRTDSDAVPAAKRRREVEPSKAAPLDWCRWPGLLVRYIDQTRSAGRYYNVKMRVQDITSPQEVSLLTPEGKTVDGVTESQVETVVPKAGGAPLMIVKGAKAGKRGVMHSRDKVAQAAVVVIDGAPTKPLRLSFYDICSLA